MKTSKIKNILGLILIVALLAYFLLTYNFREVFSALARINYIFIIPLLFLETMIAYLRASRLSFIIDPIKKIKASQLFPIYCIGMMTNLLMPFLTGQGARIYLLSKKSQLKKTFFATTTILEFLFDAFTLLGLVLIISLFKVMPGDFSPWHFPVVTLILIFVYILLVAISKSNISSGGIFERAISKLPAKLARKISDAHLSIVSALQTLKSTKHFLLVTALSILSWLFQAVMVYLLILAFGLQISIWGAVFITVVITIMMTIVIAPVNIGTFQAATVAALHLYNIAKSEALAFSFILHIAVYMPPVILGAVYSIKEGLSFKQLEDESEAGMRALESNVLSVKQDNSQL